MTVGLELARIHRQPHEQHQEQYAELPERVQSAGTAGRKHERECAGRDPSEQRGSQEDARHHLADDEGLTELMEECPNDAGGEQDQRELHHQR